MKGFTLIEFLIVMVCAGIVLLIAWPIVYFYVEGIRQEDFYSTATAIAKTAEGKCLLNQLNNEESEIWVVFENGKMRGNIISYNPQKPLNGQLKVDSNCQLSMAIHDGNFCAQKRFNDDTIIISMRTKEGCNIETSAILDIDHINYLIAQGYVPIASTKELMQIKKDEAQLFGKDTIWEDEYIGGLDKKYIQVTHIVNTENLLSIGSTQNPFQGIYNGNNLYIYGLKMQGERYNGLFAVIENAEISNINLYDLHMNDSQIVGGLVGLNKNSLISEATVTGEIRGDDIAGCLVGKNQGEIENSYGKCFNYADHNTIAGGLVGVNNGVISKSHSSGAIINGKISGGLLGKLENGIVQNSYATTAVNGRIMAGGLVGQMLGESKIENSYAIGKIVLQEKTGNLGGLVGIKNNGEVINSYYNQTTTELSDIGKGIPQTNEQMLNANNYENWDFNQVWQIHRDYNNGFPFLRLSN